MLRKIGIQKSGKANAVRRKRVSILNVNVRREENRRVQARRFALRFGGAALAVLLVGLAIMGTRVLGRILFTQNPRYAIRVLDIRTDGRLPPELVRR
ncbi:MAG: hypothetical protein U1E27_08695, partial [Kiritimatiellia bacterium]|nr:hypothetical protein [Kiritimatiellia bacterium]